ncbi:alkaline phosphatase PhoX [Thalassobacillus pellis]|uniref:alkaline phosphatase PhoX n=1 Tax=Thalassobacillus pellis TaxID=748008 RepID=UPI0019600F29|nr:alkaline phosphatase PhoX [Thalassobacillus pellis]MBM7553513.1 secreted PhoX family phosphatase [Thalassobacillus pellis]
MAENKHLNRRDFLKVGGMSTAAIALGSTGLFSFSDSKALASPKNSKRAFGGYGPLVKDPGGIMDLPRGFQYRIISEEGGKLSDGRPVPAKFDGMAAFPGPKNSTVLVRNHELSGNTKYPVIGRNPYQKEHTGGTTALVVDNNRKVSKEYVSSSGTIRNCAGGATPWGTWLTCEETLEEGHGYVFEVDPADPENKISATPIREMGAFSHEATAVDPETGIVYLTEDAGPSYLYRFLPNDRSQRVGALQKGGKLQAAAMEEMSKDSMSDFYTGKQFGIIWKDVDPEKPTLDAGRKNCIQFSRLEGAYFEGGVFWFDDTSAGDKNNGRVYRYIPATNTLELFYESTSSNDLEMPDNICITPWGDLWIAEDGGGVDRIIGMTPEGETYLFAENKLNDSELAGPTFSHQGDTFFVNIQTPGITFAIWGPFARKNAGRRRQMGHAAPPEQYAPKVSENISIYAELQGISELEVAAFERHGMPIKK